MKSILFSTLALVAYAVPIQDAAAIDTPNVDFHKGLTREQEGHKIVPGGMAPEVQPLKPIFDDYAPGSQRVKIRYGKHTLPKVSATTLMSLISGEQGTYSTVVATMKKPCEECSLVTMQAGLEYANGTEAEPSNGGWLHHIVMLARGANRKDAACNIPAERFFSSGNEKTPTAFSDVVQKKVKSAFPIHASDSFSAQMELMNMIDTPLDVWLTVDYEFIPGPPKPDWLVAKAVWLDITGCGASSMRPPVGKQQFTVASKKWTSDHNGMMLGVGGHLHDGGVNVNIYHNDKVACDSRAVYSTSGGGMMGVAASPKAAAPKAAAAPMSATPAKGMAGMKRHGPEDASDGMAHIKTMKTCSAMGAIKKGDTVHIDANYNFNEHMGMKSKKGDYTDIMGIAILYIAMEP